MIEAAGGVVLRAGMSGGLEVLVVHRPTHGDWSLPKGHLDRGEAPEAAAVREVAEETGVACTVGVPLGTTSYPVGGDRKVVHWFLLEVVGGDPADRTPDDEVDVARWIGIDEASSTLTHDTDLGLVTRAVALGGAVKDRRGAGGGGADAAS